MIATNWFASKSRLYSEDDFDEIELDPGTILRRVEEPEEPCEDGWELFEVMTGYHKGIQVECRPDWVVPIPVPNHRRIFRVAANPSDAQDRRGS
jgi:hypothetical protein